MLSNLNGVTATIPGSIPTAFFGGFVSATNVSQLSRLNRKAGDFYDIGCQSGVED